MVSATGLPALGRSPYRIQKGRAQERPCGRGDRAGTVAEIRRLQGMLTAHPDWPDNVKEATQQQISKLQWMAYHHENRGNDP